MQTLRQDAQTIIDRALADAMPDSAVRRALEHFHRPSGRLVLIAAGKAAWQMAKAAYDRRQLRRGHYKIRPCKGSNRHAGAFRGRTPCPG